MRFFAGRKLKVKKIKFVILALFVMLAGAASLSAALTFSPPSPRTGETVTFTVSPTTGTPTGAISWNFGDGTPVQSSGGLTMTHVYAAAGSYTAKASYATMSHFQVDQATVVVNDPRQVTFFPPLPKAGQAIAFTAFNFYSSCIRWDFGDATIKNGAIAESHTYAGAGNYTVHAYEECGSTYGAEVMVTVAKQDEQPPDEEPPPVTPTKPSLAVAFLNLYFAGGKAEASVAKDFAGLQAFADIQVTGNGILQWQWLVDGMVVKADTMAISFDNKFSLDSGKVPGLPTAIPGRHQVTLRFQNPKTDFAIPAITYFVGLRGPAPAIHRVTPATLAPGAEYKLELEGAELTPGTEISFPAPLALVKKANILSPTQAQVIVFVAPTAAAGTKLVTVKNEYGESSGPGQVTIVTRKKYSPDKTPALAANSPASPVIDQLKTIPRIMGSIDCYPFASPAFADAMVQLITNDDQAISNAIVKVDGVLLASSGPTSPTYTAKLNLDVPLGHQFTVSVSVDGITYKGSGGKIDNIVQVVKPTSGATINPLETAQIDFQWTYSSGSEPMQLYILYKNPMPDKVLFSDPVAADHVSVSTSPVLNTGGPVIGRLRVFLSKEYAPVVFEGLAALKCKVLVFQSVNKPQIELIVSDRKQVPPPDSGSEPPPKPSPKPDITGPVSSDLIKKVFNNMPSLLGSLDLYPYASSPYASIDINLTKGGKPLSGAIIKIDGIVIPESPKAGYYWLQPPMNVAQGHVFNVSLTIDGVTYKGSGGKVGTMVKLTQPPYGATIYYKKFPSFDCKWTFSNGPAPVHLYMLYIGQPSNKGFFEADDLNANHYAVPTANIPSDQGFLYAFLSRKYDDIVFDELPAWAAKFAVFQNFGQPQSRFELSAATFEKAPLAVKAPETKPYPDPTPSPDSLASLEGFKEILKKTLAITGGIDCYPYSYGSSASYAQVNIFVKKGGAPVSGAVVKVDGNVIPESNYTPGHYFAEPQLALQPGHVFTVTAQIDGATYSGSGGKIDTIVRLTQPAHGSTIYFKKFPQFDCKWTFSNGPAQVHLYALYIGQPGNKGIFEQDLTADHVSIPTAPIPGAQGALYFFLGRKYADIKFDGLLAFTSGIQVYQNFGQPQSVAGLSDATLEKTPLKKMTGATPAQAAAAQPAESAIVTELNETPTLNGHITYEINTDPDSSMAANSTFNFSKAGAPIPDAVIKVDGKVIPPNLNNLPPDYGCQGCYKYEGPWPGIAVGHMTTISITTGGTTYTGSGGPIDSFPQLVKPADGATISLQQTPLLNLQWTGAGGIVPVFVTVTFRGGGKHVTLYNSQVNTDHVQVHLVKPYDGIPEGASGVITVSLTKECNRMVMDGMMRFTSSPHVMVHKDFYLQLVP
jgi:hypothetical protein